MYAVAEPAKLYPLMHHLMREMARLIDGVTEDEVARARVQLKTTLLSQLDGSSAVCEDIGRQVRRRPCLDSSERIFVDTPEHVCPLTRPFPV